MQRRVRQLGFLFACLPVLAALLSATSAQNCTPSWVPSQAAPIQGIQVSALVVFDDGSGSGPQLFVAGSFTAVGATPANNIAKWNGTGWSALGDGLSGSDNAVSALCIFDDGSGAALYAAGSFTSSGTTAVSNIAKWDGTSWSALGSGITIASGTPRVQTLIVFDDGTGTALYAGGYFSHAGGVASTSRVARWNGSNWSSVGTGPLAALISVRGLALFDDGSGMKLYSCGYVAPAGFVNQWNGSEWSAVGPGTGHGWVECLAAFDDGSGRGLELYAGSVTTSVAMLDKWNGSSWLPVDVAGGSGVNGLGVYDDGSGPALYVGGDFTSAGGVPTNGIGRWDGVHWSSLVGGTGSFADAFAAFDDGQGNGPALFVGGTFTSVPTSGDALLAKWGCGDSPATAFCPGDGSGTACPCANESPLGLGHGCGNSVNANGALLVASGTTSADTVVLQASGMPMIASTASIFLQGDAQLSGVTFGDGVRCADGSLIRLGAKATPDGTSHYPGPGDPSVSSRGSVTPGSGATRYYQTYYRNADVNFCPPATFNVTNGVIIHW